MPTAEPGLDRVFCLTTVLVAAGTWHTEAPLGDQRKSRFAPEQTFKLCDYGFHLKSAISLFWTRMELSDISTRSQIQTQVGVVSHLVAQKRESYEISIFEIPRFAT